MLLQLGHVMSTAPSHSPTTVSLADEEAVKRILVDTLFGLWATVNNLSRLRPSRHERYRVTVFGSARPEPGHWVYEEVKQMCSALSAMNCDIITGGGPGLMQAANEGARVAQTNQGVQSIGIRVHLPFEQDVNPFVEQAFEHATFFTRLHHFVLMSDALHCCPGRPRNAAGIDDGSGSSYRCVTSTTPRLFSQVQCGGAWLNGRARRCCAPDLSWRAPRICRYRAAWTTPQRRWPLSASTTRVGWLRRARAPEVWLRQWAMTAGLGCADRPPLGLAGEVCVWMKTRWRIVHAP